MVEAKEYGILNGGAKIAKQTVKSAVGTGVGVGVRAGVTGGLVNFTPWAALGSVLGVVATAGLVVTGLVFLNVGFLPLLAASALLGLGMGGTVMGLGGTFSGVIGAAIGIVSGLAGTFLGAGKGLYDSVTDIFKSNKLAKAQEQGTIRSIATGQERARQDIIARMQGNAFTAGIASAPVSEEERTSAAIRNIVEQGARNANLSNAERVTAGQQASAGQER